jgi:hypothetical protein
MDTVLKVPNKPSLWSLLGRVHLLGLVVWFTMDLVRTLSYALLSWGLLSGLSDAVFVFRLGEALVVLPLGVFLLGTRREPAFLWRARWIIWLGALLAGLSFLGLRGRIDWAVLALVVAGIGLLYPWLLSWTKSRLSRGLGWLSFGVLLLLHLASYAGGFLFHGYVLIPYPSAYPKPAASRDGRWQQDVRYLGEELARLHKDAYHTISEDVYWQQLRGLEEAVPALSDSQIVVEMMRIVASVGDAHTGLSAWNTGALHGVPVDLRWYSDGLHVRGIGEAYPAGIGRRVVKIGALDAEQVYTRLLPLISYETELWARLQSSNLFRIYEVLEAVGAVDGGDPVTLTLDDGSGGEFSMDISPLGTGEMVDFLNAEEFPAYYKSKPELPFWFDYREETKTLYFRYSACVDLTGFRSTMQELWELVEQQPVERLVVDLRGNGGGNSIQFERYFLPGLKKHPQLDDPERLFVLIDRGTFSSASDNAAQMRMSSNATFIGEPTGGSPNGYGEVRRFKLPNSQVQVTYSTKYFKNMDTDLTSIEPDIRVDMPAQAVFSGRDPLLEGLIPQENW